MSRGWTHPIVWGCMSAGSLPRSRFFSADIRFSMSGYSVADFATGGRHHVPVLANFGFFFVEMQYMQLVLGYSPLQTRSPFPLALPILS